MTKSRVNAAVKLLHGVITKVFRDKGFAFVRGEDGIERFIHATTMEPGKFDLLVPDCDVSFEHQENPKGPRAIHVERIWA